MRRANAWRAIPRCLPVVFAATLSGCSVWFFSGEHWVDRSRPVALVETTGGVELGATTEFGVLTLGRTAVDGPCRVHFFLGPTPMVESGTLTRLEGGFTEARIDLKTQHARALDHSPTVDDDLVVMWTPDGLEEHRQRVRLATGEGLAGDLLEDPGVDLPVGATLLCRGPDGEALFAGLIAGRATVTDAPGAGRYYVFAGVDRVRELLATPEPHPTDVAPKFRADGVMVLRPVPPQDPTAKPANGGN